MDQVYASLANAMALLHLGFIALLIVGGPLAMRRPRLFWIHLTALGSAIAVNLTGMACPLTVWEKGLDRLAGNGTYDGGFISHYLVEPIYAPGMDGTVNLMILAAWMVPTAVAYTALGRSKVRTAA